MKIYVAEAGFRSGQGKVMVEDGDARGPRELRMHTRHSPTGHSWGYGGSGPAQLALDMLWDVLGEEPRAGLYQDFKFAVIGRLNQDAGFRISEEEVLEYVNSWQVRTGKGPLQKDWGE